jgi:hypothetical protein
MDSSGVKCEQHFYKGQVRVRSFDFEDIESLFEWLRFPSSNVGR